MYNEIILESSRAEEVTESTPNQDIDSPTADEDPKLTADEDPKLTADEDPKLTANKDTETPAVNKNIKHSIKKWRLKVLLLMKDLEDHPMNDSDSHSDTADTNPKISLILALLSWQDKIPSLKE